MRIILCHIYQFPSKEFLEIKPIKVSSPSTHTLFDTMNIKYLPLLPVIMVTDLCDKHHKRDCQSDSEQKETALKVLQSQDLLSLVRVRCLVPCYVPRPVVN